MNTVYYSLRSDPEVFFLFGGYDTRIRKESENKDRFTKQMLIFGLPLAGGSFFYCSERGRIRGGKGPPDRDIEKYDTMCYFIR